ncbi:MAG: hypothetical protein A2X64_10725 [Ignavibacteria bacterium GWF2_33_9]|nr:MAG: hypothetical protein A2X64_10725 [Ignavibacteria bacterium GWF2_33_9]
MLFFCVDTFAQKADEKKDSIKTYFGKSMIITANRRVQNVQEISNSAFIIEKGELRGADENNFEQILKDVPGLEVYDENISIRGSDGFDFGIGSRTLLMYDGIPLMSGDNGDSKFNLLPLSEIQAIDIVKGAGSALYGSSAIGGVINLISTKLSDWRDYADHPFKIDLQSSFGFYTRNNYDQWNYADNLSAKSSSNVTVSHKTSKYGAIFSGIVESDQSYRDYDDSKTGGVFGQFFLNSNGNEYNLFGLFNSTDRSDWVYWNSLDSATIPPTNLDRDIRITSSKGMVGFTGKNFLSSNTFLNTKASLFYTSFFNNYDKSQKDYRSSQSVSTYIDLQGTSLFNSSFTLTYGLTMQQNNVSSFSYGLRNQKIFAGYMQMEYNFSEGLIVNLGGRYDFETVRDANENSEFSPKLGLNYTINENAHLRAAVGKGFRAPSIGERFASISYQGFDVVENPYLHPESSWNFEIGGNFRFLTPIPMQIDGTIFSNYYSDLIEPLFTDVNYSTILFDNISNASIYGFEFAFTGFITEDISFSQSYTYLDPMDTDLNEILKFRSKYFATSSLNYNYGIFRSTVTYRYASKVEKIDDKLVLQVQDAQARVPMHVVDLYFGLSYKNKQSNLFGIYSNMDIGLNVYNALNYYYTYMVGNLAPTRFIGLTIKIGF